MDRLQQKITATTLFSDEDKSDILAGMGNYSESDITALEHIIDEFDASHQKIVAEYKASVYGVLDDIVQKAKPQDKLRFQGATSIIRNGMDMIPRS